MIKAIIIDLDGTTLPRNWHQISEENRNNKDNGQHKSFGNILL